NTNQRGVPAALLLDIKQLANSESQGEQILREIFDRLQRDPQSPLVGKLSASKSAPGKISRVTFNRAVTQAMLGGILSDTDHENRYKVILNYLNAFDAALNHKEYITRSAYFEAIFEILDEVVRNAISIYGNAKQESIQQIIHPLAQIDISENMGTSINKR